ncbi:MAG: alpha/beta hydrolase [Gemmatimonadaceae bacterium]|nr:alpha/beta hydrolase [Acetobacteraceae bacterium]
MIDPQADTLLQTMRANARAMPDDTAEWLRGYRAQLDGLPQFQGPAPDIDVVDTTGPGGIVLRAYRPRPGVLPTVLFCHGGGFVAGTLRGYDIPLRWLALRSGWQVVAVDYRVAPEHPYPAGPDDCRAALRFLGDGGLGADAGRLSVAGDSAGGLLATLLAREAGDLRLALQVLLYPNTDLRQDTPHASRPEFDGTVIRLPELYRSLALYLGATDRTRPDVSPLLAPDLSGLCPALLITNEHDPLRDEAEAYGARLRDAGVPVEHERMPGMIHGALQYGAVVDAGDRLITRVADALRAA